MAATFTVDLGELFEEAFERATGGVRSIRSGYDYKTARRSLNIMTMEWANRGINLWTLEEKSIPLQAGVATYTLPADTIDILEHTIRTSSGVNQHDRTLARVSASNYSAVPNKKLPGFPNQVMVERLAGAPKVTFWPIPEDNSMTFVYWRMKRIEDAGSNASAVMDIPFRFVPAMIAGVSFYLAQKLPEGADRAEALKIEYEQAFELAALEDRERATVRFVPKIC